MRIIRTRAVPEARQPNPGHWLDQHNLLMEADLIQLDSSFDRTRETPSAALYDKTN